MQLSATSLSLLSVLVLVGCGKKGADGPGSQTPDPEDTGAADYEDADGDGFMAIEDCDDEDASTYPGAPELCDSIDNDCDNLIDDDAEDTVRFYADTDGDGFGDGGSYVDECALPSGYVENSDDCDDSDAAVNPDADEVCNGVDDDCDTDVDERDAVDASVWFGDGDADGFGDAARTQMACEQPAGFVADDTDCNDQSADAYPEAPEVCDDIDNDCDAEVDEADAIDAAVWYGDSDGDGFGDPAVTTVQCTQPTAYVSDSTDCDDSVATSFPGADEYCDGVDNDCDGTVDDEDAIDRPVWYLDGDGDGFGDASVSVQVCDQPSGYTSDATDCDDASSAINPAAAEVCNETDDNCDGLVDDDDSALDLSSATTWFADSDGDGFGDGAIVSQSCLAPSGYLTDSSDCDDGDAAVNPDAAEVCNSVDDDCDGDVDDDDSSVDLSTGSVFYVDDDGDGFGDPGNVVEACVLPSGAVTDDTDCDDGSAVINPLATEICNSVDDDCDGDVDDDDASLSTLSTSTFYSDSDGDGYGDASSVVSACVQPAGAVTDATDCDDRYASAYPGAAEYCNTRDDDCDGTVDEDDAVDALDWYIDVDGDGFGDSGVSAPACNQPSGYVADATDCDDGSGGVFPGASEICNGLDDDCDGDIDDADSDVDTSTGSTWYADADGDTYGALSDAVDACDQPAGYVADSTDCDDVLDTNYPGADEYCDGVDNDCDGSTDESDALDVLTWYRDDDGDGWGNAGSSTEACYAPSGYVDDATDCDDSNRLISPGQPEVWYDGVDSDCGADSDYDADGDGYLSESYSGTDCDDSDTAISPAATEIWYDGTDQDCDDANDYDADGDGYESDAYSGDDCDDLDATVFPGGSEVWYDGTDSDCDGASDDDADGDGFDASSAGGDDCDDDDHLIHPYAFEASDGVDNDCDGATDESPGTPLGLSDDDYAAVSVGFAFPFCGSTYTTIYPSSNGLIMMSSPTTDFSETETEFTTRAPAVGAFWDDLDPGTSGTVYSATFADAVAIYWDDVTEFSGANSNTFGTVLFDDGSIMQFWDGMSALDAIVGWTCANGTSTSYDLSIEVSELGAGDLYLGDGSEEGMYELFSGSVNPFDLDGELLRYAGSP